MNDLANSPMTTTSPPKRIDFNTPELQRKRRIRALKDRFTRWYVLVGGLAVQHHWPLGPGLHLAGGLSAGDLVVAVDGLRISAANWEKRLSRHAVGDLISVYAFRRDEWLACQCRLESAPLETCVLSLPDDDAARLPAERWPLQ